ncbi:MAG: diaminopimelate decarboxylase [Candidatus Limnocylindrales bacterium]
MREAADRFGTPAYVYDRPTLERDAAAVVAAFPDPWIRLYALKANGLPALLQGLPALGFGASAVSSGELALAGRAGFPVASTALEGIGKTPADLRRAVALAADGTPLLWVSLESADEAAALAEVVRTRGRGIRVDVLVRLNPQVRPETHRGLAVGAAESKFGVLPEELASVIEAGGGAEGPLRWRGIHIHVGSQLGAVDAWRSALRVGLRVLGLQRAALADFDTLDAGSGFPVDLGEPDSVPSPELFAVAVQEELAALPADARPRRLAIEPGRVIVARSGWLLAHVLHVRDRERQLVVLDAGMTELIRPALYDAEHPLVALTSLGREVAEVPSPDSAVLVRVDGPICESTDRLGEARLPPLRRGDLVAIGVAGAYGSSMASTYNGRPRPPEVAWDGTRLKVLRRRGSVSSLP